MLGPQVPKSPAVVTIGDTLRVCDVELQAVQMPLEMRLECRSVFCFEQSLPFVLQLDRSVDRVDVLLSQLQNIGKERVPFKHREL